MEVRDVITGALEILADEGNWVKFTEDRQELDADGQVVREQSCLWGAMKRAVSPWYYLECLQSEEEMQQAYAAQLVNDAAEIVGSIIWEQYPDRGDALFPHAFPERIVPFNDHRETVHAEVVAVLEKALAREH